MFSTALWRRAAVVLAVLFLVSGVAAIASSETVLALQDLDEEVPPGNPVLGDDRPGDIEPENDTNYVLWLVVGACLVGAGVLLVKVERWESRRRDDD